MHEQDKSSRWSHKKLGLMGTGFSTVAIAVGAIMYWAVTYQGHGFRFSTVGVTYDREATDAQGRSTEVHEEVR